jgi:hypothetical protein
VSIDLGVMADAPIITRDESNAHTGMASWWASHVTSMSAAILVRHKDDLGRKLEDYEADRCHLTESDRMEITESIKVIEAQLDEILPHAPGDLEEYDRMNGNRILGNWPLDHPKSGRLMHTHFCELIEAWRMNGMRNVNAVMVVDEIAESQGISAFTFDVESDLHDFIRHYDMSDFVNRVAPYKAGISHDQSKVVWYLILSNKFTHNEVREFLLEYNRAILALTALYDERRRAAHINGGRIVFTLVDHFVSREAVELARIRNARKKLSEGHSRTN